MKPKHLREQNMFSLKRKIKDFHDNLNFAYVSTSNCKAIEQSKDLRVAWKMGFTKLILNKNLNSSINTEFEDSEFNLTTLLDNHGVNKLNFAKHIN